MYNLKSTKILLNLIFVLLIISFPVKSFGQFQCIQSTNQNEKDKSPFWTEANYYTPLAIKTSITLVNYKQFDPLWRNDILGTCSGTTIWSAGCAMTCVAMILATSGDNVDPGTLNTWLTNNNGYLSGCNIIWAAVNNFSTHHVSYFNTAIYSFNIIKGEIDGGNPVIAWVNNQSHFVLIYGYNNNGNSASDFLVSDPGNSATVKYLSDFTNVAKLFLYHTSIHTISGYVKDINGDPLSSVTLNFSNGLGDATTDFDGYYVKDIPQGWSGTITPITSPCNFTPEVLNFTNVILNLTDQNFVGSSVAIPTADLFANLTTVNVGQTVSFTDYSTGNPTGWFWTFGDGGSSSVQNPQHSFNATGVYDVMLIVNNSAGSSTITKTSYINVSTLIADFYPEIINVNKGASVYFIDESLGNPTSWNWTFSGGIPSSFSGINPPSIQYNNSGTYIVSLNVSNSCGSDTKTRNVNVINVENTTIDVTILTNNPFPTNYDKNITFYSILGGGGIGPFYYTWDFADGTHSSSASPTHTYSAYGTYIVYLTVTSTNGLNGYASYTIQYQAGQHCDLIAGFSHNGHEDNTKITVGNNQIVQFISSGLCKGYINSYQWQFGDGTVSSLPNPIHIYTTPGTYPVLLRIEGYDSYNNNASALKIKPPNGNGYIIHAVNFDVFGKWISEDGTSTATISNINGVCSSTQTGVNEFVNGDFEGTNGCVINNNSNSCERLFPFAMQPRCIEGNWFASHGTPNYNYGYNNSNNSICLAASSNRFRENPDDNQSPIKTSFYSEGIFYKFPQPLNPSQIYRLTFMAKGKFDNTEGDSDPFQVVDRLNIKLAKDILPIEYKPDGTNCNYPEDITKYLIPSPLLVHNIGTFHTIIDVNWRCYEVWFTPPGDQLFDEIWIYPESKYLDDTRIESFFDKVYLDNFYLTSESICINEMIFGNCSNLPYFTSVTDHIIAISGTKILNGQDVNYQAGNYISLKPDFIASENCKFRAYISPCTNNKINPNKKNEIKKDDNLKDIKR